MKKKHLTVADYLQQQQQQQKLLEEFTNSIDAMAFNLYILMGILFFFQVGIFAFIAK